MFSNIDRSLTEEDVDAHESDGGLLCWKVGGSGHGPCDGYDELADGHPGGSHQEEIATAHFLDEVEAREGRDDVDTAVGVAC